MGRYPKLGPYKVVSFAIEIDKYQMKQQKETTRRMHIPQFQYMMDC